MPAQAANALTYDQLQGLTYLQVKGSGVANTCPVVETGTSDLKALKPGSYKIEKFCMSQPPSRSRRSHSSQTRRPSLSRPSS